MMNAKAENLETSDTNYGDLRDWLDKVDRLEELTTIRGANRDLEIPGIWEIVSRESGGIAPALLFDEIPGFPAGFRILFGELESVRRLALTLGLRLNQFDIFRWGHRCRWGHRWGQVFTFDIDIFQELLASDITPGADFYDWTFLAGDIFPVYSCFEAW